MTAAKPCSTANCPEPAEHLGPEGPLCESHWGLASIELSKKNGALAILTARAEDAYHQSPAKPGQRSLASLFAEASIEAYGRTDPRQGLMPPARLEGVELALTLGKLAAAARNRPPAKPQDPDWSEARVEARTVKNTTKKRAWIGGAPQVLTKTTFVEEILTHLPREIERWADQDKVGGVNRGGGQAARRPGVHYGPTARVSLSRAWTGAEALPAAALADFVAYEEAMEKGRKRAQQERQRREAATHPRPEGLADREWEAFQLVAVQGQSYREAAEQLGASHMQVGRWARKVKAMLQPSETVTRGGKA